MPCDLLAKIYVAGHRGLVGSGIVRALNRAGYQNIVTRTSAELDLTDQAKTHAFLEAEKPDFVILAAALVGGIQANRTRPADFIGVNLAIQQNVIWGAHQAEIQNLMFLGSSCIYPRDAAQPMPEETLLTGPLEPTNTPYAIAKIAGLTLCESLYRQYGRNYFTVMPPNIYGPGDNFDPQGSHVMAAMIRRFHEALPNTPVTCWGTGTPRREFLHVDDMGEAVVFLLNQDQLPEDRMVNVGTGTSITIKTVAETVQKVIGHEGEISWDDSMPDGYPEKTNDVSRIFAMGWRPKIALEDGIAEAYEFFKQNYC
ncbi:MAG: GDP-L-fucose synthase [Armatimonadetes bacterium]|nr:GDP-L-fucose synthase [Armatimonadota bacterium]